MNDYVLEHPVDSNIFSENSFTPIIKTINNENVIIFKAPLILN